MFAREREFWWTAKRGSAGYLVCCSWGSLIVWHDRLINPAVTIAEFMEALRGRSKERAATEEEAQAGYRLDERLQMYFRPV